jgi:hypothetical protein
MISLPGWHCIQAFFVLINEAEGKLVRNVDDEGVYKGKYLVEKPGSTVKAETTSNTPAGDGKSAVKYTSLSSDGSKQLVSYSFNPEDKGAEYSSTGMNPGATDAPLIGPANRPTQ